MVLIVTPKIRLISIGANLYTLFFFKYFRKTCAFFESSMIVSSSLFFNFTFYKFYLYVSFLWPISKAFFCKFNSINHKPSSFLTSLSEYVSLSFLYSLYVLLKELKSYSSSIFSMTDCLTSSDIVMLLISAYFFN